MRKSVNNQPSIEITGRANAKKDIERLRKAPRLKETMRMKSSGIFFP